VNLDAPLEGAAADLHLVVVAVALARAAALAGDDQRTVLEHDLHLLGIDTGELDHDHELRWILGAVAIDLRPEAVLARAELSMPKLGYQPAELIAGLLRRIASLGLAHVFVLPPNADYASVPIEKPRESRVNKQDHRRGNPARRDPDRAVLVPSLMAPFGRYNWWLPSPLAKLVRVKPSPLAPLEAPVSAE
jgi:hypothetical protein